MKKTYLSPQANIYTMMPRMLLMVSGQGLDNFDGYGGGTTGGNADAPEFNLWNYYQ